MNIKLERKIRVIKYKAILDIGRKIERSDFIALLLIAKANNNQLSKEIICKEFLFRDHEQMAENVLRRCIDRDLIDNEYRITKEGFEAINVGMIYEYYDGVCYIYVTNDPIIPQKILDFEFLVLNCLSDASSRKSRSREVRDFRFRLTVFVCLDAVDRHSKFRIQN